MLKRPNYAIFSYYFSISRSHLPGFTFSREVADEEGEQSNEEKLMAMRAEYEKYKELWGLNLQYSHSARAAENYSELDVSL